MCVVSKTKFEVFQHFHFTKHDSSGNLTLLHVFSPFFILRNPLLPTNISTRVLSTPLTFLLRPVVSTQFEQQRRVLRFLSIILMNSDCAGFSDFWLGPVLWNIIWRNVLKWYYNIHFLQRSVILFNKPFTMYIKTHEYFSK